MIVWLCCCWWCGAWLCCWWCVACVGVGAWWCWYVTASLVFQLHGGPVPDPPDAAALGDGAPVELHQRALLCHDGPDQRGEHCGGGHGPDTNPTRTRHGPDTNPTRTRHGPDTNPTRTRHGPDTNPTRTRHEPDTDPTRTRRRQP